MLNWPKKKKKNLISFTKRLYVFLKITVFKMLIFKNRPNVYFSELRARTIRHAIIKKKKKINDWD